MSNTAWSDDEIRKSIDVLDQVLSEFDDIEPYVNDGVGVGLPVGDQEVPFFPPPIDRTLKPRYSPPSLPQKHRSRSSSEKRPSSKDSYTDEVNISPVSGCPNFTLSPRSTVSKRSEVSSHEYQEINTESLPDEPKENTQIKSPALNQDERQSNNLNYKEKFFRSFSQTTENDRKSIRSDSKPPPRRSKSGDMSLSKGFDPYIERSSTSQEGSCDRRRIDDRRRGRSSDRLLDRSYPIDPRRLSESTISDSRLLDPRFYPNSFVDPRMLDLRFNNPRMQEEQFLNHPNLDPRFVDRRLFDPGLNNVDMYDPRFVDPNIIEAEILLNEGKIPYPIPDARFSNTEALNFPHLMPSNAFPHANYTLPQPNGLNFHPAGLTPYQYPLIPGNPDPNIPGHMNPNGFIDYPVPLGVNPAMEDFTNPLVHNPARHCGTFPINYPVDYPVHYPPEGHHLPLHPRDRLSLDAGGRPFPLPLDPRFYHQKLWFQNKSQDLSRSRERISRSKENLNSRIAEDNSEKFNSRNKRDIGDSNNGRDHMQKINREPNRQRRRSGGSRLDKSTRPGSSGPCEVGGHVAVGDKIIKGFREFGGKDTVAIPHHSFSGGKDSGFDETLHLDDQNDGKLKGSNSNNGGSFVVAGVFTDSSKMYIPAPPSPVPDYDKDRYDSGDEDADIPHEPFYISNSKAKKDNEKSPERKSSSDSNKSFLSQDSLQINYTESANEKDLRRISQNQSHIQRSLDSNPLKKMIDTFHKGLSTSGYEERGFSDDSLEDKSSSNASPQFRHKKPELLKKRPTSFESLVSIDSSTASFDYITEFSDNTKLTRIGSKRTESVNSTTNDQEFGNRKQNNKTKDIPKFDTVKNLMKEGLIEGLDEMPPDFVPPPPPTKKSTNSVDRADSGIGSNASTKCRRKESLNSNNSPEISPQLLTDKHNKYQRSASPPPAPPPRDTSLSNNNNNNNKNKGSEALSRNQSWLHKTKPEIPLKPRRNEDVDKSKRNSIACVNEKIQARPMSQDLSINKRQIKNQNNGQPSIQLDVNKMNSKNLELNSSTNSKRNSAIISDDSCSVSSSGSKTGKLFSRFTESLKSANRSNSPLNSKSKPKNITKTHHADFIRVPHNHKKEAPKPPSMHPHINDLRKINGTAGLSQHPGHPSFISAAGRDGTGRFRSFENLTEHKPSGKSLEFKKHDSKDLKRNTTLPLNSTASDDIKNKKYNYDNSDENGPRFKFNVFKGLWRRNKYSFEKS